MSISYTTIPIALCLGAMASTAVAVPVNVFSDLDLRHNYVVNNGTVPDGILLSVTPQSLDIRNGRLATINDPAAIETTSGDVVVGNPFTDPPLPFQAERTLISAMPNGSESASASFDVDVTSIDDPNSDATLTSIIERDIDNQGAAQVILDQTETDASASSFYGIDRGYTFENTSQQRVSFSIDGSVRMQLSATVLGGNGLARASGGISMLFDTNPGADVTFSTPDPYVPIAIETGAGASITDVLLTDFLGSDGFRLSAGVTAIGDGAVTEAFYTTNFDYQLDISLDAGATLFLVTSFQQANSVETYIAIPPGPATVPLPASLPLLLMAFAGVGYLRRTG